MGESIDGRLFPPHREPVMRTTLSWYNVITFNTLRPRQNGRHFADDIFKRIFFNENVWISIKISLKFDPKGPINKILALFQIMAWRRPGDKQLSEAMLVSLLTHKCVIRLQWVKRKIHNCAHTWVLYRDFMRHSPIDWYVIIAVEHRTR